MMHWSRICTGGVREAAHVGSPGDSNGGGDSAAIADLHLVENEIDEVLLHLLRMAGVQTKVVPAPAAAVLLLIREIILMPGTSKH